MRIEYAQALVILLTGISIASIIILPAIVDVVMGGIEKLKVRLLQVIAIEGAIVVAMLAYTFVLF